MRTRILIAIIAAWLFGGWCGVTLAGLAGYDYRLPVSNGDPSTFRQLVERDGWEPYQVGESIMLRRPHLHVH